ncbi:MAG TPA: CopD family protein [Candidatus Binataceae bacterium]
MIRNQTLAFAIALHLFGAFFWVGSLLVISRWLAAVPNEVGIAKERFIVAAKRLYEVGCNIGAGVSILFGVVLVFLEPEVLEQGWFHVKLLLIAIMLFYHVRFYRRIIFLENKPSAATRREFLFVHGAVSAILLAILVMAVLKPF